MSFNNIYDKKKLQEEANRADPNFGDGSFLLRPEDTSIQGASEDFMKYLNDPFAEVKQNIADDEIMDAAAPGREMFDQLKGNNTPDLPQALASQSMSQESGMSSKGPQTGFTPPNTPPTSTPQEDILAQLKAARAANEAAMGSARAADRSTELGNLIMKSGAMAGQGIVNRAGNTNIKLDPAQVAAKEAELAGISGKGRLDALMQDYGIKKGIEDTAYSRKKDEQARIDRLSERAEDREYKNKMLQAAQDKAKKDTYLNKEEVKEDIQIKKENRKYRQELDTAIPALEAQLKNIREAKTELAASKIGTGPIDEYISKYTDEGQSLKRKLNKISLDSMVKLFAGMSKAVDTNAERAMFQSTQPDMGTFQNVNEQSLSDLEKSVESMIAKSKGAISKYDREGGFTQPEEKQSTVAPKAAAQSAAPYGDTVDRNGKTYKWNASAGKYQPIQ